MDSILSRLGASEKPVAVHLSFREYLLTEEHAPRFVYMLDPDARLRPTRGIGGAQLRVAR
jgi:hypothetical protein